MFNLRKKAAILSMTAVLAATAASSLTAQASDAAQGDTYQLSIVYNNDIHGRVDRLPQFKTLIDQAREECDNLLVLNGGDIFLGVNSRSSRESLRWNC